MMKVALVLTNLGDFIRIRVSVHISTMGYEDKQRSRSGGTSRFSKTSSYRNTLHDFFVRHHTTVESSSKYLSS